MAPSLPASGTRTSAARPDYSAKVTISFDNKASRKFEVTTFYSYPISPVWVEHQEWCVEPGSVRQTSIDFNFPDPDVAITVADNRCNGRSQGVATIPFYRVVNLNGEHNKVDSHVSADGQEFDFCATLQSPHTRKCTKLK